MNSVETMFAKSKYIQLNELGYKMNLSFSSQLILGDKIIALDGIKRKLLVWEVNKELHEAYVIDLNQVAAITIRQSYRSIGPGELKYKEIGEFLIKIDMQFNYRTGNEIRVINFYDYERDSLNHLQKLERNAKIWQMILSKMLVSKIEKGKDVDDPLVVK